MATKCIIKEIKTNFILLGLFILVVSYCKAQLSSEEKRMRFQRHMMVFKEFPCGLPQQRSIRVEELLGDQLETSESATPHITVLHRCDRGTGCCAQQAKECKMVEEETISLHFYVSDQVLKKKPEFKAFKVKNHTRCSCESIQVNIK